ncbi:hypothetical protein J1N35_011664 [Gossypium stocksii]|uniref:Uncharacterized protein n=1 Tax=Gossypium stocksii TaxID=47602 RepID=A0A9D4ADT2_9ROSI|nr:hypothetical protein J1N35_011664 [Gossypium stocksii]
MKYEVMPEWNRKLKFQPQGFVMFYARNTYMGMPSSYTSGQSASDFGCNDRYIRSDDVLPTTCIDEGTFDLRHVTRVEIGEGTEFDSDPIWECEVDGLKI